MVFCLIIFGMVSVYISYIVIYVQYHVLFLIFSMTSSGLISLCHFFLSHAASRRIPSVSISLTVSVLCAFTPAVREDGFPVSGVLGLAGVLVFFIFKATLFWFLFSFTRIKIVSFIFYSSLEIISPRQQVSFFCSE